MPYSPMDHWHVLVHSRQTSFIHILQKWPVAELVCEYLPHSMSKNKLSTFLRLRAASFSTLRPIAAQMPRRIRLLQKHRLAEVSHAAEKIQDPGFIFQLFHCGGRRRSATFLKMDERGIPRGMALRYWDQRQREKKITGWSKEGKLLL